jgi:hypothetical protein
LFGDGGSLGWISGSTTDASSFEKTIDNDRPGEQPIGGTVSISCGFDSLGDGGSMSMIFG